MKLLIFIVVLTVIITMTVSATTEQQQQQPQTTATKPSSWTRFGLKWIKSLSAGMESATDSLQQLLTADEERDEISAHSAESTTAQNFFRADPIRTLASAMTSLVGGRHSVATQRTTLPKEDRKMYETFYQQRNRERVEAMKKRKSTDSNNNNNKLEQEMLLDEDEDTQEQQQQDFSSERSKILYKNEKKFDFSKKVISKQERLHNQLHPQQQRNNNNNKEEQYIVTGKPTTTIQQEIISASNSRQEIFDQASSEDRKRFAQILATTPPPAQAKTRDPNLVLTQDVFASSCGLGGVTAIEYSPEMNFTCYRDGTTESNFTVNGSVYADNTIFETELNRTNCVPNDISVTKYCICPFDKFLLRASTGEYYCWDKGYNCEFNVTEPKGYQQAKQDALKKSLGLGVPLRIPYVDTIDRRSTSAVHVKINLDCNSLPYTVSSATAGSTLVLPSQVAPASTGNTSVPLVGVYFGGMRSSEVNNSGSVIGDYNSLRETMWNYLYRMTEKDPSTVDPNATTTSATTNNNNNIDATRFLVTPTNFLAQTVAIYMRPHSFINFADLSQSTVIRIGSNDSTSLIGPGVLVGRSNISLSFIPSQLSDHHFAGQQLYVEVGMVTRYDKSAEENVLGGGVGNQFGQTPFAELIAYDITNGPPPLPKAPPEPLATSTIVLITIGVITVIAGITAIVVGVVRRRNLKKRKNQKRRERKELREKILREEQEREMESETETEEDK